jgi:predicted metal-dependent phosphotriesterase family hydrolase
MCCRKALAITGSESHSLRAPGRVARRNKRPLELHASGGLFFLGNIP